ncbi:MAG: chitobiase/beta-hexosaminidase C-terminal domain-containing protein [Christensenellales bacterium]|jgi:hypothetical protein
MAIHLHKKYADTLAKLYTHHSFIEGHTNKTWSFSGLKSLIVPSIVTQPLTDYTRSGTSRYGSPQDLQDTLQEMTMTQDKAFSIIIDKGDNSEQQMMKRAGEVMQQQIAEQVVPTVDRYALCRWFADAGRVVGISEAPDKSSIIGMLLDAEVFLNDSFVPDEDRWCYVPNSLIKDIRLSDEFSGCDSIVKDAVVKGYVGNIGTLKIVGMPARYFPEGAHFLVAHKDSVILAQKLRDGKIHQDPPGISGHLLEGRYNYDAFVLGAKCCGVYAVVDAGFVCKKPVAVKNAGKVGLTTETEGATILFTTDGSDPRYSTTAATYTAAFDCPAGVIVKSVAKKDGMFNSPVDEYVSA